MKKQVWKKLLISCLVAIQCLSLAPMAMAQGDSTVSQPTNTTGPLGPVTEETPEAPDASDTDPIAPPVTPPVDNEGMETPETNDDTTIPSTGEKDDKNNPATYGIDTTIYGSDVLVILANSNIMIHNNVVYRAPQPITVKNGVSFVSLRTLTERFGYSLTYDNVTKESIINNGGQELRYKMNTDTYKVDGVPTKMSAKSYIDKGTFMVPLTSALQAYKMPYEWDNVNKRIIVQMSAASAPVAKFSVVQSEIFAGQTEVTVKDQSFHPRGKQIVQTEWTGLETIYNEPGQKTISLRVLDIDGVWSEPFSVSINVLPPNEPPVASFTTSKDTYKMGEFIAYEDVSTDDEDAITERVWENNAHAFFKPGTYYVTLRVTDKHGASSEVAKKITITDETLYTFDEFNQLYTEIGEAYTFKGSSILDMKTITPVTKHLNRTLYRTNSPESIKSDGIVYQDKIAGATRVLLHHKNATTRDMKLYVIAKNISGENATVRVEHTGIAGPNPFPQQTGKYAAERYFDSFGKNGLISEEVLKPNQSTILVKDLSKTALKPDQIYTMYADFSSDNNLQYQIVALDASKDIMTELPKLTKLDPDGVHIRGTFNNSDRKMTVKELVGDTAGRLLIADNKQDLFLQGWDTMNGDNRINAGNYGVLYHIELERVAPNTLISFNARGGSYAGAVLVNGQTVGTPNKGVLGNSNDASVIYRTGDSEEKVDLWFTPAAGSSMPVNLLFVPLPDKRTP